VFVERHASTAEHEAQGRHKRQLAAMRCPARSGKVRCKNKIGGRNRPCAVSLAVVFRVLGLLGGTLNCHSTEESCPPAIETCTDGHAGEIHNSNDRRHWARYVTPPLNAEEGGHTFKAGGALRIAYRSEDLAPYQRH